MDPRNEISLTAFDEATGVSIDITTPGDITYPELLARFKQFCIAIGYTPETIAKEEALDRSLPDLCCNSYETCQRPCVHRGFEQGRKEGERETLAALIPFARFARA